MSKPKLTSAEFYFDYKGEKYQVRLVRGSGPQSAAHVYFYQPIGWTRLTTWGLTGRQLFNPTYAAHLLTQSVNS
jgi:hypothetical protein